MKFLTNFIVRRELQKDIESRHVRMVGQYLLVVAGVFFAHFLHNALYIRDLVPSIVLGVLTVFFLFLLSILKKGWRFKFLRFFSFAVLIVAIFVFQSYSRGESGIYLYYFPLSLAIPFIFDLKKDIAWVFMLLLLIALSIIINIVTDYSLLHDFARVLTPEVKKKTFVIAASISGIITIANIFFIDRLNNTILELHETKMEKEILLKETKKELEKAKSVKKNIQVVGKLIELAKKNDVSFYSAFETMYPTFVPKLLSIAPDLTASELEICAMFKLNFTTKEIAKYSKMSVRAVEGRSYRARKKLNLPPEEILREFILNLDL